jgi:glycosyltransferase involved in cell wall biosynthesis
VIHNGIRQEAGDRERVRRELGLGEGELLIVAVGNLYPVKGHAGLIDAVTGLAARATDLPPWRLAIAGRGAEEARLRQMTAERRLDGRVQLLGFREDAADVIAAADVFALPSLSEGLPLALAEAMFAGKAIVASSVGGIPEIVNDGVEALLTPSGDAAALASRLESVLRDGALRARLGDAARRRAEERLSVERMTDEYERIYHGPNTARGG